MLIEGVSDHETAIKVTSCESPERIAGNSDSGTARICPKSELDNSDKLREWWNCYRWQAPERLVCGKDRWSFGSLSLVFQFRQKRVCDCVHVGNRICLNC